MRRLSLLKTFSPYEGWRASAPELPCRVVAIYYTNVAIGSFRRRDGHKNRRQHNCQKGRLLLRLWRQTLAKEAAYQ